MKIQIWRENMTDEKINDCCTLSNNRLNFTAFFYYYIFLYSEGSSKLPQVHRKVRNRGQVRLLQPAALQPLHRVRWRALDDPSSNIPSEGAAGRPEERFHRPGRHQAQQVLRLPAEGVHTVERRPADGQPRDDREGASGNIRPPPRPGRHGYGQTGGGQWARTWFLENVWREKLVVI